MIYEIIIYEKYYLTLTLNLTKIRTNILLINITVLLYSNRLRLGHHVMGEIVGGRRVVVFLRQPPVSLPQVVGASLGLPAPREDTLLVTPHSRIG